jgi:hypothetical protein
VQDALQHVYKISSNRDRPSIALATAVLIKACADASVSTIADNPRVVAAVAAFLAAATDHLKVRVEAEKNDLFSGLLFIRPVFNRTREAVDKAKKALNDAIHEAWIEAEGRDPRNDNNYHNEFCAITGMDP